VIFSLFYKTRKENKGQTIAQWINLLQNNRFVNRRLLSLMHEKIEAVALTLPGLTAGRQACWQAMLNRNLTKYSPFTT